MKATIRSLAVLGCAAAISVGSPAQAQANPELGDTGAGAGTWAPPASDAEGSASASTDGDVSADGSFGGDGDSSDSSDSGPSGEGAHADMVGRLGIGFFGVQAVPICTDLNACGGGTVSVPAIGVRYWLDETLAIEGALGFGTSSGTATRVDPNNMVDNEILERGETAFLLHAAVPIALAASGNFVFEVVPEMNVGYAMGTQFGATAMEDQDVSGLLFSLGGRAGAEIHFGFIGIPQLSLQGTVGLQLEFTSRTGAIGASEGTRTTTNIRTSVQNSPWDIFTGGVAAIYYL